ncbi:MAG TPA: DUF1987 domain-containing protein [Bacteroidia bacterium]|nr:DUF1987 domain-containing protein [Bacteroidia bacterium]
MNLSIESTEKTPKVNFNTTNNELVLEGICIPELTHEFFKPVINFIHTVEQSPVKQFSLTVKLHFFNTGSARYILELMKTVLKLKEKGIEVTFKWYYNEDDEDIEEAGRSYSFILNEPFDMISFKS